LPAPQVELKEAILGRHKTLGEEQICGILPVDVRDALPVAPHFDRFLKARQKIFAVDPRQYLFRSGQQGFRRFLSRSGRGWKQGRQEQEPDQEED
jgi:hypothetical protein